jgi:hypothetical protein
MAQDPFAVDLTPPVAERGHVQRRDDVPLTLVQYKELQENGL